MGQITLEKLLKPISKEEPCGEILAGNPDFYILKDMLDGKEETQWRPYEPPDWKNILRLSKKLLLKGKNLWVVVIFIYASTEIYGLEGLKKGLQFLNDITIKFWDDIQPELEPESEDDYTLSRLCPLATMSSQHEHLCRMLNEMRLIETQRIGKFNFNDIKILTDETAVRSEAIANIEIEHIGADLKQEKFEESISLLKESIEICGKIDAFITEKVGEQNNISNLNKLTAFMNDMLKLFGMCIRTGEESVEESVQDSEGGGAATSSGNTVKITKEYNEVSIGDGIVKTEEDVVRQLKYLIKWYEINYPMSPIPEILQRGIDIVGLKFEDMMKVLTGGNGVSLKAGIKFSGAGIAKQKVASVSANKEKTINKKQENIAPAYVSENVLKLAQSEDDSDYLE